MKEQVPLEEQGLAYLKESLPFAVAVLVVQ
jgi:hypothetical protein